MKRCTPNISLDTDLTHAARRFLQATWKLQIIKVQAIHAYSLIGAARILSTEWKCE